MVRKMSNYEYQQVNRFLHDIYCIWGRNLDEDDCRSEGWIVYLEGRRKYRYNIGDREYWEYVEKNYIEKINEIRKKRNKKYQLESEMSLNKIYGDEREEIGNIFPSKAGNFENSVILWDYIQKLGNTKNSVLHLMAGKEDDDEIMKIMRLSEEEYYTIKLELRDDFLKYINS